MKISVGLPATIPGASVDVILEWAKRADKLGFSSLGIIDRIVYPNYESLMTLAAAAAITSRIRLMTTIVVAPARQTAVLAKQAATLDRISSGRLTLGLGVGGRQDDFEATGEPFKTRGRRFDEQLATMKRLWSGGKASERAGPIGPQPLQKGGPEILIGGYGEKVGPRVVKWGDGFISGGSPPEAAASVFRSVQEAWKKSRRSGMPRFVCSTYFALGENAAKRGAPYLRDYYAMAGVYAENVVQGMRAGDEKVKESISLYSSIGADEVMLWPTIAEMDQLDRLARFLTE